MDELSDLLAAAAPRPRAPVDVAALQTLLRRRRRRAAAAGVAALAVTVLTVTVVVLPRGERVELATAPEPWTYAAFDLPPIGQDARLVAYEEATGSSDAGGGLTTARLLLDRDGIRWYLTTPDTATACLLSLDSEGLGAQACGDRVAAGRPVLLAVESSMGGIFTHAGLVPDGFDRGRTPGGEVAIVNNLLVLRGPTPAHPVTTLTGPAGTLDVRTSFDTYPYVADGAAAEACPQPPGPPIQAPPPPPALGIVVTAPVIPQGFGVMTEGVQAAAPGPDGVPTEPGGIAAEYGTPSGWSAAVASSSEVEVVQLDPDSGRAVARLGVTSVQGAREALCATLHQAATHPRAQDRRVRGHPAVLHPPDAYGASLLLWQEAEELQLQVLGLGVQEADLLALAEHLEVATVTPAAAPPPPEEQQPDGLLLSHPVVSSGGQHVAIAQLGLPGVPELDYGLEAALDVWTTEGWRPFAFVVTGLGAAGRGFVAVETDPHDVVVPLIGFTVPEGAYGQLQWLELPTLGPGWYRFRRDHDGASSVAPFEVVDGPRGPQLAAPTPGTALEVAPNVVTGPGAVTVTAGDALRLASGPVTLERAEGLSWVAAGSAPADVAPAEPIGNVFEAHVTLPELEPGAYRLSATDEAGTSRFGYVLVVDA